MRKTTLTISFLCAAALCAAAQEVMTKTSNDAYVVNSRTLCSARGFRKTTPVEVHISGGKVTQVVALKNEESANYFSKVKQFLLPLYNGVKISKAKKLADKTQIDGCTGATFSTRAVQANIKAALTYYEKYH